jgi:hypothetical protein
MLERTWWRTRTRQRRDGVGKSRRLAWASESSWEKQDLALAAWKTENHKRAETTRAAEKQAVAVRANLRVQLLEQCVIHAGTANRIKVQKQDKLWNTRKPTHKTTQPQDTLRSKLWAGQNGDKTHNQKSEIYSIENEWDSHTTAKVTVTPPSFNWN